MSLNDLLKEHGYLTTGFLRDSVKREKFRSPDRRYYPAVIRYHGSHIWSSPPALVDIRSDCRNLRCFSDATLPTQETRKYGLLHWRDVRWAPRSYGSEIADKSVVRWEVKSGFSFGM